MSRQPPLPPGPPPRRDDLYRPGAGPDMGRYPPPPGRENYKPFQFSGNSSYQSSGGRNDSYTGQGRHYNRDADRFTPSSYRPPQGDFTFRQDAPRSIVENSREIDYQPRPPRGPNNNTSNRRDGYNQRGSFQGPSRGRGGYRGRGGFVQMRAAERPMLQSNREPTPERMAGMDNNDSETVKFRAVEDMSDSGGPGGDLPSENQGNASRTGQESEQPRKKQARTAAYKPADGDSVPRWSNPDPYTALPPPDESQGNKKDILGIIRKHKVVSSSDDATKVQAAADDFISFDLDEEQSTNDQQTDVPNNANEGSGMLGAPTGPRAPAFSQQRVQRLTTAEVAKARAQLDKSSDPALGSRKRTIDDNIKDKNPQKNNPSAHAYKPKAAPSHNADKGRTAPDEVDIVPKWQLRESSISSPWCINIDHSRSASMGVWLHKEIVDFYEHVKPRPFEEQLRGRLVRKLQDLAAEKLGNDYEVRVFGSFASGLYLPTADMDFVVMSKAYINSGYRDDSKMKSIMNKFQTLIRSNRLAKPGSLIAIKFARVPILKYVDAETGLSVDISFENIGGVRAIATFEAWKRQFPAMPIIVTLLKQFLAMRGLNEPATGGIGGFTVTCLVVSLLQNLPSVQSGNLIPEHHLNEILMEFFNLYGNDFNPKTTAVHMNPPGYIQKSESDQVYKQSNITRLSVIDPNKSDNDIAGGSKSTPIILDSFSRAYFDLTQRMGDLHYSSLQQRYGQSILGVILGGNYQIFEQQRRGFERLHREIYR